MIDKEQWFRSPEAEQAISLVAANGHLVYRCTSKLKNTISYLAINWKNTKLKTNRFDYYIDNLQDLLSLAIYDKEKFLEVKSSKKNMNYSTVEFIIMYNDNQETRHSDLNAVRKQLIERFLEENGMRASDVKSINPLTKKVTECYKVIYGHMKTDEDDEQFTVLLRPYSEIETKLPQNWIKKV